MGVNRLTSEEINAVFNCKYFGDYWGEKDKGLCPAATIAQMRGLNFDLSEETGHYRVRIGESFEIVSQAVDDLAAWLGLMDSVEFYEFLTSEREKILNRAPKQTNQDNNAEVNNGSGSSS